MFNVKLAAALVLAPAIGFDMEDTIKLPKLRRLIAADLIGDVDVVGRRGGWVVRVHTGDQVPPVLAAANGAVRVFTTADSAVHQLIRLGVTRFHFVADEYESGTLRAPRPDRAAVLKQQSEYEAWLKAKLDAVDARLEAGTEPLYTPEEAWARVQERLALHEKGGEKG
ncbi:hypothetical protein [Luteibacter sp.]|uniref:hypothetical protein n=1 Tax=Luteibacter sp. TaxID=1886636 RepID=UPI003F7F8138